MKAKQGKQGHLLGLVMAAALGACGGGGGDSPGPCGSGAAACRPLLLQGTAAVGLAVSGAQVKAKCLNGQGTASTDADGRYRLSIPGAELPCALELTHASSNLQLHSVAVPAGNSETANFTLLTEMVTTRLARRDAASYFASFDAAAGKALSVDKVRQAQDDVAKLLAPTTEIRDLKDYLGTPLKAATAANPYQGDAQDKLLDALHSRLDRTRQSQLLGVLANAAAPVDPAPFRPWITVEPKGLSMLPGASQVLLADMNYPPDVKYVRQPVKWSVADATGGTVDAISGKYTASMAAGVHLVRAAREDFADVGASLMVTVGLLKSVDQRGSSGIKTARQAVVQDQAAWTELWSQHLAGVTGGPALPSVDFGKEMVVAVFLGQRPDGCYSVSISGVSSDGGSLLVNYREDKAAADAACTQALSAPAHLVKLPKSSLPVQFIPRG